MAISMRSILMVLGAAFAAGKLDVEKATVQSESMEDLHKKIKGDSRLQWSTSALEVVQQQLASSKAAEDSFKTRLLQVEEKERTLQCAQSSCTSIVFMEELEQAMDTESFLFDQLGEAEAKAQEMQCQVIQLVNQLQQSGNSYPQVPAEPASWLQQGYTSEVEVLENLNTQYDKLQQQLASTKKAEESFQAARLREQERPQATCAAHIFLNQIMQTVSAQKFLLQSLGEAEARAHELQCQLRHLQQQFAAQHLEPEPARQDRPQPDGQQQEPEEEPEVEREEAMHELAQELANEKDLRTSNEEEDEDEDEEDGSQETAASTEKDTSEDESAESHGEEEQEEQEAISEEEKSKMANCDYPLTEADLEDAKSCVQTVVSKQPKECVATKPCVQLVMQKFIDMQLKLEADHKAGKFLRTEYEKKAVELNQMMALNEWFLNKGGAQALEDGVRKMIKMLTDGDGGNGSSVLQQVNTTHLKNATGLQNKTEVIATARGQPFAIHKTDVNLSPPVHRMGRSKRAVEDGVAHEIWKHALAEGSTQPLAH